MPITFQNFLALVIDAADCKTEDQYIAEAGSSVYADLDADEILSLLHRIWIYHTGGLCALRKELGLSRISLSRAYGIPIRTLENWDAGVAFPQKYVSDPIAYALLADFAEK